MNNHWTPRVQDHRHRPYRPTGLPRPGQSRRPASSSADHSEYQYPPVSSIAGCIIQRCLDFSAALTSSCLVSHPSPSSTLVHLSSTINLPPKISLIILDPAASLTHVCTPFFSKNLPRHSVEPIAGARSISSSPSSATSQSLDANLARCAPVHTVYHCPTAEGIARRARLHQATHDGEAT